MWEEARKAVSTTQTVHSTGKHAHAIVNQRDCLSTDITSYFPLEHAPSIVDDRSEGASEHKLRELE